MSSLILKTTMHTPSVFPKRIFLGEASAVNGGDAVVERSTLTARASRIIKERDTLGFSSLTLLTLLVPVSPLFCPGQMLENGLFVTNGY